MHRAAPILLPAVMVALPLWGALLVFAPGAQAAPITSLPTSLLQPAAAPLAGKTIELAPPSRSAIAEHWAPTIYQETRSPRDLLTAFDYDGDWDGSNNTAHIDHYPMRAQVYYTALETATHWLVTYLLYHPVDAKTWVGHDHDTEHLTMAIRKDGSRFGRLELMETRFHEWLFQYAGPGATVGKRADNIDGPVHFDATGHPTVYVQRVGHGVCGGFAPLSVFDTWALRCHHREAPHIGQNGVVYRYSGVANIPPDSQLPKLPRLPKPDNHEVGYALIEIGRSVWLHARDLGPHATFKSTMDYRGERCAHFDCPHKIGAQLLSARGHGSTGMPWNESAGKGAHQRGDTFFDPAYTLSQRLAFAQPFSMDYLFNPYLGVGHFE